MRDVTLFIADEKQEMILSFLDKWYFKKKRRMNDEELKLAAQELKIDEETMGTLQDNYLEHKKIVNTRDLHEYLLANNRIRNGQVNLPISLQRYFVKTKNPYLDVQPRVYEEKKIYNPYKMNEWEHKVRADKSK